MNGTTASIPDLLDELSREHDALLPELAGLARVAERDGRGLGAAVAGLAEKLTDELDRHITLEDNILFPTLEAATGNRDLVRHFIEEHRRIQQLRDDLLAGCSRGETAAALQRLAIELSDLLTSHMGREDMMLFPMTRELVD